MAETASIESLKKQIDSGGNILVYIGSEKCSVCRDFFPKIEKLMAKYPKLKFLKLEYSESPEIRGLLSVYTVPAIIGYIDGKEFLREARFISLGDIDEKINRYYEFI